MWETWPCLYCGDKMKNKAHFCRKTCECAFKDENLARHIPNVIEFIVSDEKEPILATATRQ